MVYPTRNHPTRYHYQRYVYPVVSRRAGGVSIGVNLSPSKRCNFGCIYCQVHVDRTRDAVKLADKSPLIDLERMENELRSTARTVSSGALFSECRFVKTPPEQRVLKDFAFSGDGEPTLSPQFVEAVNILSKVRREEKLDGVKLVLITNSTTLQNESTIAGCDILAANNGEIWAKLDAGMDIHYRRVNGSSIPFNKILDNLIFASRRWPLKIQTMLMAEGDHKTPSTGEMDVYCQTIEKLLSSGAAICAIQLYTVARTPYKNRVSPLSDDLMKRLSETIGHRTGLPIETYFSH